MEAGAKPAEVRDNTDFLLSSTPLESVEPTELSSKPSPLILDVKAKAMLSNAKIVQNIIERKLNGNFN